MSDISITTGTGQTPLRNMPDDTFALRSFSSLGYLDSNGLVILAGSVKENYRETTGGTLDATTKIPTYPTLVLPASTNASNDQTGQWTTVIVDATGKQVDVLFEDYEIPHYLGAAITLLQLTIHNEGTTPVRDRSTLTRSQIELLIASAVAGSGAPKMTDVTHGIARLSDAAANSADPIVEGSNSARLAALSAATHLNTASAIVKRDASGNFAAGAITASLTGSVTGAASLNVLKAGDTMTGPLKAQVYDKGGRVFDPRANGALIDGTTDDTAAWVQTLADLVANGGGTLLIPESSTGSLIGGAAVANQIFSLTVPCTIQGSGVRSVLIIKSDTPATTDVIRITPPTEAPATAEFFLGSQVLNNGGYHLKDFVIRPQSGTPARDAIRVDVTGASGKWFEFSKFEGLVLYDLGGKSISLLNKSGTCVNTDGIYDLRIEGNWLYDGIYAECLGDSIRILNNRFRGTGKALEVESFVSGAGHLQLIGNNMTADGGVKITGGIGHRILGNFIELYKPGASGSGGACLEITGGAQMVTVRSNLFGSLGGNLLNGVRVDTATAVSLGDNFFNIPATKFGIQLTANATSPTIFGINPLTGGGALFSNASIDVLVAPLAVADARELVVGSLSGLGATLSAIFSGLSALDTASIELNRGSATSTDTKFGSLNFVTNQTGTTNNIGAIYFANSALGTTEKRTGLISSATDGATNSGRFDFWTANAGTLGIKLSVDKTGVAIGSGTALTKILKGTVTIDPASIGATTVSSQTFTLTGAVVGDSLRLNPPALTAGLVVCQYYVSGADQITVVFYNTTGAPIDQASGTWTYALMRG